MKKSQTYQEKQDTSRNLITGDEISNTIQSRVNFEETDKSLRKRKSIVGN